MEPWTARRLLKARRTGLVIGLGGYASLGPVLAARRISESALSIHEANVFPGLANRDDSFAQPSRVSWLGANCRSFRRSKTCGNGQPGASRQWLAIANQPREKALTEPCGGSW